MGQRRDLTNMKAGRLTVLSYAGLNKGKATWLCVCECGKETVVPSHRLVSGKTKSCGCLAVQHGFDPTKTRTNAKRLGTRGKVGQEFHSMCGTPTYASWQDMKRRCYSPKYIGWHNYGGRGITVCERWRHSFLNFFADMGLKPNRNMQLDRIDNNKGYSPDNCRWATPKENGNNTRLTRFVSFNDRTLPIKVWGDEIGIAPNTLVYRLDNGWPVEIAMTAPVGSKYKASLR